MPSRQRSPATALATAMAQKGLCNRDLSRRSGVHEATISRLLHGKHVPAFPTVHKLASVLDVDPITLRTGECTPSLEVQSAACTAGQGVV